MARREMFELEWDGDGGMWHETKEGVASRVEREAGFPADEVVLMEGDSRNGIYTRVSFSWRGFGYCIDFDSGRVGRAAQWDES